MKIICIILIIVSLNGCSKSKDLIPKNYNISEKNFNNLSDTEKDILYPNGSPFTKKELKKTQNLNDNQIELKKEVNRIELENKNNKTDKEMTVEKFMSVIQKYNTKINKKEESNVDRLKNKKVIGW